MAQGRPQIAQSKGRYVFANSFYFCSTQPSRLKGHVLSASDTGRMLGSVLFMNCDPLLVYFHFFPPKVQGLSFANFFPHLLSAITKQDWKMETIYYLLYYSYVLILREKRNQELKEVTPFPNKTSLYLNGHRCAKIQCCYITLFCQNKKLAIYYYLE
ncbi:hypothetical protein XELAEV_18034905mg [Xenopus laevis]|uniref:Uncharacterized protein n=1 Tax=Xenopus laevis TaxID=8355 RepID=A0A974HBJ5_XENLA|nr:hypothetical protein XELAEV_18034905mg [Xenopus laevis]